MTDEATPVDPESVPVGEWRQAKPNPGFPPEVTYLIRFYVAAKDETLPPCPVCKSKRRGRWTMLCPFTAKVFRQFTLEDGGTHEPLTLVCSNHPIAPTGVIMEALAVR